jgi:hypothetical protein
MLRRLAVLGVFVAGLLPLGAVGAMASTDGANGKAPGNVDFCVAQGGFTIQVINVAGQTPRADRAGNENGMVCVKVLSTPDNAARQFVVIDDHSRTVA